MIRAHTTGKTFVLWQPARKYTQSYHDYASFCHDMSSVLSTEGSVNVNIDTSSILLKPAVIFVSSVHLSPRGDYESIGFTR